jgi:hypothetical protein
MLADGLTSRKLVVLLLDLRIIADALIENLGSAIQGPGRFTGKQETAPLRKGTLLAKGPRCCEGAAVGLLGYGL